MATVAARQSAVKAAGGASLDAVSLLPYAVILVAALILRHALGGVSDVSWQITLSEKILAGQRLYIDLLEVNPPASTFLYLPAVALARVLHVAPELLIDLQTLIAACAALFVAGRIVMPVPQLAVDSRAAGIVLLAILVLLPLRTFAQREHYALIAMLPLLAVATVRATGGTPLRWHAIAAGICGGIMVCIKPHFALAILLIYAVAAIRMRSVRPMIAIESWIAAAIALAYAAAVFLLYPDFVTGMMPLLADLYLPARQSLANPTLITPALACAAAFATMVAVDRGVARAAPFQLLFAASLGFTIAYLIQGKGWPYQALPMLALTVIAFAFVVLRLRDASQAKRAGSMAGLVAVTAGAAVWLQMGIDTRAIAVEVRRVAQQPSIAVISGDIAYGHPLTRDVGGRWLSAVCSLWIMDNAMLLDKAGRIPDAAKARIAAHVAVDRARLIADIRDGKPDIILVDETDLAWTQWASREPAVSAQLANYSRVTTVDGVTIYKRKTSPSR